MRKLILSITLFMGIFLITGCVKKIDDEETENQTYGIVIMAEYSGNIIASFTDENTGKNCITVDTETEEITFTLIDSTRYIGGETVAVGDAVCISCEEYSNSDYRPIIEIIIVE